MSDMIFLAAGYAVFWIATFAFIYSLASRQRSLRKDLDMLEQLAQREIDT